MDGLDRLAEAGMTGVIMSSAAALLLLLAFAAAGAVLDALTLLLGL